MPLLSRKTPPARFVPSFVGNGVVLVASWSTLLVGASAVLFVTRVALAESSSGTFFDTVSANPPSLFPITDNDGEARPVQNQLFENLLERNWETYDWMPQLASKWEISKDGKQFTFTIDPKAKFSDGTPVTADDVKFSYDVIFLPGVESAFLKPYYENIGKVEVLAKDKVRFTTKTLYYKNFDVCAELTIIQKKHYLAAYEKDHSLAKAESTHSVMGTSQWVIDRWDDNQQLILKRREDYWNKETLIKQGRWNFDRIVFKIIPEEAVAFETLKKGDLTYKGMTPKQWALQSDGPEFKERVKKVKTTNKLPTGYTYIGWNQKNPILADKDVRWALAHLMNMRVWIDKFDFGLMEPTVSLFSPKTDEADKTLKPIPFDPKEARTRLAKAGWKTAGADGYLVKDGKKFEITILYVTQAKESIEPKLTEYKNQAAKVGVSLVLKAVEWTTFQKLLDERNFDAVTLAWSRGIDDDAKQIWHSASIANKGSNFIGYANPVLDKLIDEQRETLDRAKRLELDHKIDKIIYDDQPYAFMTERKFSLYAHQSNVKKDRDTFPYSLGSEFWRLPKVAP